MVLGPFRGAALEQSLHNRVVGTLADGSADSGPWPCALLLRFEAGWRMGRTPLSRFLRELSRVPGFRAADSDGVFCFVVVAADGFAAVPLNGRRGAVCAALAYAAVALSPRACRVPPDVQPRHFHPRPLVPAWRLVLFPGALHLEIDARLSCSPRSCRGRRRHREAQTSTRLCYSS